MGTVFLRHVNVAKVIWGRVSLILFCIEGSCSISPYFGQYAGPLSNTFHPFFENVPDVSLKCQLFCRLSTANVSQQLSGQNENFVPSYFQFILLTYAVVPVRMDLLIRFAAVFP